MLECCERGTASTREARPIPVLRVPPYGSLPRVETLGEALIYREADYGCCPLPGVAGYSLHLQLFKPPQDRIKHQKTYGASKFSL